MAPASVSPEELIRSAWDEHPIEVRGFAASLAGIQITLVALTTIAVGLRVWARGWVFRDSNVWGWDDSLAVLSLLTSVPACTFGILAIRYGLGTPDSELTDELRARASIHLSYWLISYTVSTNLAKAGIAVALLRLTTLRRYRYPIYAIITLTPMFVVGMIFVMVYTCRPLGAQWNADLGPCPTRHWMADFSYAFTGATVILDWGCAIIPYLLLRGLQMQMRTKISLFVLLTFGGFAGVCALIRVPYLKYYYIQENQLYYFGYTVLWSTFENAIGLIAASLPPIHKLLSLYFTEHEGSCSNSGAGATETIGGTPMSRRDLSSQLKTLRVRRMTQSDSGSVVSGPWHRLERADSSREHIIRTETIRSTT